VIWDGIWAGGGPNGECSASEHAAFWAGAEQGVREARLVREVNGGGDWGALLAVHQRPSRVWSPTATQ
jgi:hypothetical protein